jgi:hypothetical protein
MHGLVFRTKMPPLETIDRTQIPHLALRQTFKIVKNKLQYEYELAQVQPVDHQCLVELDKSRISEHNVQKHKIFNQLISPLLSKNSLEPLASQMWTFFSASSFPFVLPRTNHNNSSAMPRQNTLFVVSKGNMPSRKLKRI